MTTVLDKKIEMAAKEVSNSSVKTKLFKIATHYIADVLNNLPDSVADDLMRLSDKDLVSFFGGSSINMNPQSKPYLGTRTQKKSNTSSSNHARIEKEKIDKFLNTLRDHGGFFTSKDLEEELNITKSAVNNRKARNSLFSVKVGGKVYFPKLQFNKRMQITKPFREVLDILKDKDSIASFFFLLELEKNHQGEEKVIYEILKDKDQKPYIFSIIKKRAKQLLSN